MILNQNQQSEAQLIGDIQNNKVGIDTNNIDFITSLLTTNLYSQPIESFIRETVANGWDSHVEAGTTDKPVIIRIYKNNEYVHIVVRDYGTGLSPERFNEIYLNVGSSTKRQSNNYIGMFGIGRFSSLAVSDTVHLTNYYNGTYNKYVMYKDGSKICIDKLFEAATEEESGLEVDVHILNNYDNRKKIARGIKQLTFYNNVYIDDPEKLIDIIDYPSIEDFNVRKIEEFNTFKVCDCGDIKNCLLMGNVLYPIEDSYVKKWFAGVSFVPFAIKCDIGDVDITPSRENLLYSEKTINTINSKCEAALNEFKEICKNNFGSDFKTLEDYYNFYTNSYVAIDIQHFDTKNIYLQIPMDKIDYYGLSKQVTVNGSTISTATLTFYKKFRYMYLPSSLVLYRYDDSRFRVKDNRCYIYRYFENYKSDRVLLVNEPLSPIAKSYWRETCNDCHNYYFLYKKNIRSAFRKIVKDFCKSYDVKPTNPIIKFILKDFVNNYTKLSTYGIEDVPQTYIDSIKAATKTKRTAKQARKCVVYELVPGRAYDSVSYEDYEIRNLASYKGTAFFAEKGNAYLEAFYTFFRKIDQSNHVKFVEVAPTNIPLIRELPNTVEFNTIFTEKNNLISKVCTLIYLSEKWNITRLSFCDVDKKFKSLVYSIIRCKNKINETESSVIEELMTTLCKTYYNNNWLNYKLIYELESNKQYLKINDLCSEWVYDDFKNAVFAFYEYMTKTNLSNLKRFNEVKNKLKPILDEYTPNQELPHFNVQ